MRSRTYRDRGQAFPAYVAVIAGLLLLGFVYFVVGRAAGLRNGAQTAADATALAAAQDARQQLREGWLGVIDDPTQWQQFVVGEGYEAELACQEAMVFAARNDATVDGCSPIRFGFKVTVRSTGTVGDSVVPATQGWQAVASATAVIEPRCSFEAPDATAEPEPPPTPPAEPEEEDPVPIVGLECDGSPHVIDPEDPDLPDAGDLFRVRLTGDDE
ncbi:pilus assembly protein TadG-related protein [Streptomyces roseolus]|uniref:pilus assembly protein TadG-related protein n=1 Tax=Streptomyces roseolus TaxID=67358 RepID=UPI0036652D9C